MLSKKGGKKEKREKKEKIYGPRLRWHKKVRLWPEMTTIVPTHLYFDNEKRWNFFGRRRRPLLREEKEGNRDEEREKEWKKRKTTTALWTKIKHEYANVVRDWVTEGVDIGEVNRPLPPTQVQAVLNSGAPVENVPASVQIGWDSLGEKSQDRIARIEDLHGRIGKCEMCCFRTKGYFGAQIANFESASAVRPLFF